MGDAMKALEPAASRERNASRSIILAFVLESLLSLLSSFGILSDFMSEEGCCEYQSSYLPLHLWSESRGCQEPAVDDG